MIQERYYNLLFPVSFVSVVIQVKSTLNHAVCLIWHVLANVKGVICVIQA